MGIVKRVFDHDCNVRFEDGGLWFIPKDCLSKIAEAEYIPLDLSKEEDRQLLRGKWIKSKATGSEYLIASFRYRHDKGWRAVLLGKGEANGRQISENYTHLDGSAIAKEEEWKR